MPFDYTCNSVHLFPEYELPPLIFFCSFCLCLVSSSFNWISADWHMVSKWLVGNLCLCHVLRPNRWPISASNPSSFTKKRPQALLFLLRSVEKAIFNEIFSFVGLLRQARRLMRTDSENFCISTKAAWEVDGFRMERIKVEVRSRWNILKFPLSSGRGTEGVSRRARLTSDKGELNWEIKQEVTAKWGFLWLATDLNSWCYWQFD